MTEQERLAIHICEHWSLDKPISATINKHTGRVQTTRPSDMSLPGFWVDVGIMADMHGFRFTEARCNSHPKGLRCSFMLA